MNNFKSRFIISGLFSIVTGLMLVLLRGGALGTLLTVVGIGFIASGLLGVKRIGKMSIMRIIIGICTIVFGNTYINLSLYILGIAIIVFGVFKFKNYVSTYKRVRTFLRMLTTYIRPILIIAAGICVLFNPMGSIESLLVICGILLIVEGVSDLCLGIKWDF